MENVANDIGAPAPSDAEVDEVLKELDTNNDGKEENRSGGVISCD